MTIFQRSMSEASTIAAAGEAPARRGILRAELGATVKLALPMALTQLGQIAMLTTDVLLVGRLGAEAVAAVALGANFFFLLFIVGMGIVTATAPLAAQAYGARDARSVRRVTRMGLWAGLIVGFPSSLVLSMGEPVFVAIGQDAKLAALAGEYLSTLLWCSVPAIWLIALRNFVSALNRPRSALWVMLAGIPLNAVLVYALVFGRLGMPEMGIAGAGLATTLVQIAMVAIQAAIAAWGRPFREYRIFAGWWRPDWPRLRDIFTLGVPIFVSFMLEAGVFIAAVVLMGWLGTVPLAAHQIAVQIASVTFMVPFGIAQAATVRVGHAVGRGDAAGVRRAGWTGIALGTAFMGLMAILLFATRFDLPALFLDSAKENGAAVIALAASLLIFAALFQMADGVQAIAMGALRGMSDARIPMLLAALSYWVIGFSLAYALGFPAGMGAVGIWIGLSVGLACAATLLALRFRRLSRRGYLPDVKIA
jgi:MATE family multidrug resistance protein